MQQSPQLIKEKLLRALDKDYNVLDMPVVEDIIGLLERTPITREALETTRLGKYINELRRKTTNEGLAKRAKDLVRKWRDLIVNTTSSHQNGSRQSTNKTISPSLGQTVNSPAIHKPLGTATWNKTPQISPALNKSDPSSPASRLSSLSPGRSRPQSPSTVVSKSASTSPHAQPLRQSDELSTDSTSPRGRGRPRGRPPLDPEVRAARASNSKPPGSSPPSRGRGRPPKNKNKLKKIIENETDEIVPKNSPANKRLRKDSDEDPPSKKQKLNGIYETRVPDVEDIPPAELNQVPNNCDGNDDIPTPKKRGRKKGSKNAPKALYMERDSEEDLVKAKMASVVRNPKVKTTKELLASIQKESSLDSLRTKTLTSIGVSDEKEDELNISKTDHIHKFLRSQDDDDDDDVIELPRSQVKVKSRPASRLSDVLSNHSCIKSPEIEEIDVEKLEEKCEPKREETIDELLAKLPKINYDEIDWSDSDDSEIETVEPVTDERVERLLTEHLDGVNGNYNEGVLVPGLNHGLKSILPDLGESSANNEHDDNFREWQECVSKTTYNGELLHILPYVIID